MPAAFPLLALAAVAAAALASSSSSAAAPSSGGWEALDEIEPAALRNMVRDACAKARASTAPALRKIAEGLDGRGFHNAARFVRERARLAEAPGAPSGEAPADVLAEIEAILREVAAQPVQPATPPGTTPPGVTPGTTPPGTTPPGTTPPGVTPGAALYTLRSGDTGWSLAERFTGSGQRWRELLGANPALTVKTINGQTQIAPWRVGQTIALPPSWASSSTTPPGTTPPGVTPGAVPPAGSWSDPLAASVAELAARGVGGPADVYRAFQRREGLDADGLYGRGTAAALAKYGSPVPPPLVGRKPRKATAAPATPAPSGPLASYPEPNASYGPPMSSSPGVMPSGMAPGTSEAMPWYEQAIIKYGPESVSEAIAKGALGGAALGGLLGLGGLAAPGVIATDATILGGGGAAALGQGASVPLLAGPAAGSRLASILEASKATPQILKDGAAWFYRGTQYASFADASAAKAAARAMGAV